MKRFLKVAMLLCIATVLVGVLSLTTVGAKTSASRAPLSQTQSNSLSCGKWSIVPAPHPNVNSGLSAVAAISANDAWAVGSAGSQINGAQTLIEHWNGTNWQIVTSPNPGSVFNTLSGVTAISSSNVWAVGFFVSTPGLTQTLTAHWNGTSWSVVKSPSPASINNELLSVSAISASNIWAAGFISINTVQGPVDQTLIEHWNGSQWSVVKSPSPGSNDHLEGVAGLSASNAWAVGNANTFGQTLIEHWNGSQWSVVKSPNTGSAPAFSGVTAVSASDVWTVGSYNSSNGFQTLIEQWNGTHWSIVASPSQAPMSAQLLGVAATSATDVWAVGHVGSNPLIEHFHC